MGIGYWNTLATLQAAGPTLSSFTTAASLLNPQAKITLPAGFFAYVGQKLLIRAQGQMGSTGTPTFTLSVVFGVGPTTVFTGGAMNVVTGGSTTLPFWLEIDLTCRTVGSSANLMGQGMITGASLSLTSVAASTTTVASLMIPNTAPAVGTNFDATQAQTVDLQCACSTSASANAVTLQQYELIATNWGG